MNVKDMVSNGKRVTFVRFQNNELWYSTECGFEFPVPVEDTGTAAFLPSDKAILFMRYINRYIKILEQARLETLTK